ncbi:flagellar hook-associated protein FlgL [Verminephrobacter eiseniae]|uniref:flagellar hook-associated protein FlgL n=1 Tax=Verminephrobacter eiseniae TaxID=364317 RepID=UPI0010D86689|nr:flagellar hook-associated protein FlgL [Verminephrobacter eiseniae]KAB7633276.1 flagellar hook-associated protein 3 [Verminephrobacter sp. Larva24]MCW5233376.1 flagellar hook-associated protein 3 [Verminephrobacter eiseniae]MCW5295071.1 flagellar hook-associated protein 3 [Verminephrobacter eiseniae]MCW8185076.1 flagellar hook-associated protein 3 [Verminephrobacter eiseniae]MCW8223778.1 flagellar hook-associated protein 3 [Verminephrobacter eiseniae]
MSNDITRLGTANMYDSALRNLGTRQSQLANLQENLTSGKRVVRASDDPVSAAQAERALNRLARIQSDQRALAAQRNAIALGESTLGDAVDLVQNFRALVVSAGDASLQPEDRATIANQLQSLREQLLQVANRKDTNGVALLSALGSAQTPFAGPLGGTPDYRFAGQPGQSASAGARIAATLDGDAAFMFDPRRDGVYTATVSPIPTGRQLTTSAVTPTAPRLVTGDDYRITFSAAGPGATPGTSSASYTITNSRTGAVSAPVRLPDLRADEPLTVTVTGIPGLSLDIQGLPADGDSITLRPGTSLFGTLDSAIDGIRRAPNQNAAIQSVGQALANIDLGLERVHDMRGYAGELLNRADRISGDQTRRSIQLESDRSRAEDLDMIQGISDFQNQQVGYQAALKSYAQVQRLSLFQYIG